MSFLTLLYLFLPPSLPPSSYNLTSCITSKSSSVSVGTAAFIFLAVSGLRCAWR